VRTSYVAIRFSKKKRGGRTYEVARIYELYGTRRYVTLIAAKCERELIETLLNRLAWLVLVVEHSEDEDTIYVDGIGIEDAMRRLAIFVGFRACTRSMHVITDLIGNISALGEHEAIFWFNRMLDAYELEGFSGVCRVAKAFKILHKTTHTPG